MDGMVGCLEGGFKLKGPMHWVIDQDIQEQKPKNLKQFSESKRGFKVLPVPE